MDDEEYDDTPEVGLFSPDWMFSAVLARLGADDLYRGIIALAQYLTEEDEPRVGHALDILVQTALVGYYVEEGDDVPDPHTDAVRLSEGEMENLIGKFRDVLGGLPTTDDEDDRE